MPGATTGGTILGEKRYVVLTIIIVNIAPCRCQSLVTVSITTIIIAIAMISTIVIVIISIVVLKVVIVSMFFLIVLLYLSRASPFLVLFEFCSIL